MVNVDLRCLMQALMVFLSTLLQSFTFSNLAQAPTLPGFHVSYPASFPRLSVILLLQAAFQQVVVVLAPPCSTWVAINAGTSKRTILCPGGDPTRLQNRKSNKLATRTGLSNFT